MKLWLKLSSLFLLSVVSLFAVSNNGYYIQYKGITLGKISDFSTINQGYLLGKTSDNIFSLLIPYDHYIIYEDHKPQVLGKNKYKKDKYYLLNLIRTIQKEKPSSKIYLNEKYKITVQCKESKCTYSRYHLTKKETTGGYLYFRDDSMLDEMCDDASQICFKKVND